MSDAMPPVEKCWCGLALWDGECPTHGKPILADYERLYRDALIRENKLQQDARHRKVELATQSEQLRVSKEALGYSSNFIHSLDSSISDLTPEQEKMLVDFGKSLAKLQEVE